MHFINAFSFIAPAKFISAYPSGKFISDYRPSEIHFRLSLWEIHFLLSPQGNSFRVIQKGADQSHLRYQKRLPQVSPPFRPHGRQGWGPSALTGVRVAGWGCGLGLGLGFGLGLG